MDQTDETISVPEINNQRTVEVKYGVTLYTQQMTNVNELTLLHLYASIANHVATGTHQTFFKRLSLAQLDIFRELKITAV